MATHRATLEYFRSRPKRFSPLELGFHPIKVEFLGIGNFSKRIQFLENETTLHRRTYVNSDEIRMKYLRSIVDVSKPYNPNKGIKQWNRKVLNCHYCSKKTIQHFLSINTHTMP